jgi:hypothetical protein
MAGRGPQTFKKRQKEQARKEKQLEKRAKKLERKSGENPDDSTIDDYLAVDQTLDRGGPPAVEGDQR